MRIPFNILLLIYYYKFHTVSLNIAVLEISRK